MQRSLESYGDVQEMQAHFEQGLMPHQKERVEAVKARRRILIADETGLRKTSTGLACLEATQVYPCAFVTLASVEEDILRECVQRLPWRSAGICNGSVPTTDIVILHPEVLERHAMGLLRRGIKSVIVDEAHYYKNAGAARSRALRDLADRCDVRILLTATPIKNRR